MRDWFTPNTYSPNITVIGRFSQTTAATQLGVLRNMNSENAFWLIDATGEHAAFSEATGALRIPHDALGRTVNPLASADDETSASLVVSVLSRVLEAEIRGAALHDARARLGLVVHASAGEARSSSVDMISLLAEAARGQPDIAPALERAQATLPAPRPLDNPAPWAEPDRRLFRIDITTAPRSDRLILIPLALMRAWQAAQAEANPRTDHIILNMDGIFSTSTLEMVLSMCKRARKTNVSLKLRSSRPLTTRDQILTRYRPNNQMYGHAIHQACGATLLLNPDPVALAETMSVCPEDTASLALDMSSDSALLIEGNAARRVQIDPAGEMPFIQSLAPDPLRANSKRHSP